MRYIDPHIHMSSRTTDDYERMAEAGIVAVVEPAFWMGQPRTQIGTFIDYFSSLVGWERFRAEQFGIKHYCAIGLNSKEANNQALAEEVMALLPRYLVKDGVVAVGEIGFDEQTALEEKYLHEQIELAKSFDLMIMVHTPHRDKKKGTIRTMDVIEEHGIVPSQVVIDHNNEGTVKMVLDRGYWTAFTIYPNTKMDSHRMVEVVRQYGADRIIVDSSADWGVSDPLAVPKTACLMRKNGLSEQQIKLTCYQNALNAYSQSGQMTEMDWLKQDYDQSELFEGNSVLRGQRAKKIVA